MGVIRKWLVRFGYLIGALGICMGSYSCAHAQVVNKRQFNAAENQTLTGIWTFNSGLLPNRGASNPATCTTGQVFLNTTVGIWYWCASTDTWAPTSGDPDGATTISGDWIFSPTSGGNVDAMSLLTETDDTPGQRHIYQNTLRIGALAHSAPFNNGAVGIYARDSFDLEAIDAALSGVEAGEHMALTSTFTGTNNAGQDFASLAINLQMQPAVTKTQTTGRGLFLSMQKFGAGDNNITEGITIRSSSEAGATGAWGTHRDIRIADVLVTGTSRPDANIGIAIDAKTGATPGTGANQGIVIGEMSGGAASGDFGLIVLDNNIKVNDGTDRDWIMEIDIASRSPNRFGFSSGFDSFFTEADLEVLTADDGLILRNDVQATRTRLRLADAGHLETEDVGGSGFANIYYPSIAPQDLTGVNCTVGQSGIDTTATLEFCYCQPANTWNCVALTAGGPAD